LDALLDNLDIDFAEEWRDDRYFLGWLTNCQDYHGEALDEVVKLRDFLLAEGFRGGEIIDMTDEDFERFIEVDQTQELLEEAINSL
jgi:hypothetical protein